MQVATVAANIFLEKFVGKRCTVRFKSGNSLTGIVKYDDSLRTLYIKFRVGDVLCGEKKEAYFDIGAVEYVFIN